jgi:hypothetical protein
MKKRLFPLLIALSALAVSGSAAFYSVFGLSKLFAGASLQVIIMAGSLEFAKLVVASLLYQYWDTINKVLRAYLAIACFVLMVITSGGIYGFLSGAYQSTATQSELLDKSLMILNQKQVRFEETKEDLSIEKAGLTKSISDLRIALSNPAQVQYVDKESGQLITTSSSSARRALQSELKTTITERDNINIKIEAVMDSIGKTDMALLDKEISNETESELGPLKYLAETTGYPMNEVVNWFLLLIIFVFDPLAIALVVAANMAFAQIRKPDVDFDLDNPPPPNDKLKNAVEKYKEDNKTEPSESLKQRVKENQIKLKELDEDHFSDLEGYVKYIKEEDIENLTYPKFVDKYYPKLEEEDLTYSEKEGGDMEIDERRMGIIGQNGNDGLHYDETTIIKSEEELNELSGEVVKTETKDEPKPINPTEEELEKLEEILSITYNDEDVSFDRITDTTKTFVDNTNGKDELNDDGRTLRYKGR